jgi:hypothetical protein
MLGLGRLRKSFSDATVGTAIVLAHVVLAERLEQQRRTRPHARDLAAPALPQRQADAER